MPLTMPSRPFFLRFHPPMVTSILSHSTLTEGHPLNSITRYMIRNGLLFSMCSDSGETTLKDQHMLSWFFLITRTLSILPPPNSWCIDRSAGLSILLALLPFANNFGTLIYIYCLYLCWIVSQQQMHILGWFLILNSFPISNIILVLMSITKVSWEMLE